MFCGDETGGVVFDVGSYTSKVGFAGDDMPKSVFSGRVGVQRAGTDAGGARASTLPTPKPRYVAGPTAAQYRPHMDLKPPTDFGLCEDWDAMEAVWQHGLDSIHCDPREHPMLMTEPPFSIMAQREKVAELMFEAFDVPALYLGRQPMLAAFSTGRSSGIVVDLGHSCTRVTALYDGIYMTKGMLMSEIGGNSLNVAMHEMLGREHERAAASAVAAGTPPPPARPEVLPRYAFTKTAVHGSSGSSSSSSSSSSMEIDEGGGAGASASSSSSSSGGVGAAAASYLTGGGKWRVTRKSLAGVTTSYNTQSVLDVYDDMKRSVCSVAELGVEEGKSPAPKAYELPDGALVHVGAPQQLVPELLFRPDLIEAWRLSLTSRTTANWTTHYNSGVVTRASQSNAPLALQQMVYSALLACQPEFRRELCGHVILTGGGSLLRDIQKRLLWELLALIPAAFKPRVVTPAPSEREYANWIGGSVMASLGTFQQMWISRAEYDEEGPSVVDRKIP